MDTKLSRWSEGVIEMGWLFALIATPLFFNIQSDRIFEPDKLTLLRSIALIMLAAWLVRFVERRGWEGIGRFRPRTPDTIWRDPLTVPVLLVALAYIVSATFSVSPYVSWAGSYQRLQGTYTTLSYIIIFAVTLSTMRTRAQVERLITVTILTSIPVALYGILQHEGRDPLPWGGDTQTRVAGHMGNAIFVGAYLIMVIPLTITRAIHSFRHILTDEVLRYSDVAAASICMFTLPVQLLTLFWSGSRGPWLGLAAGLFAMLLITLVSLRNAAPRRLRAVDLVWPLLFVLVGVAALLVSARIDTPLTAFLVFAGVIGLEVALVFVLLAIDRVWHWLWLSFLLLALFIAGWLVSWNLVTPGQAGGDSAVTTMYAEWRELPGIGRLGRLLEDDTGTGKVRVLIWQGALDLLRPHEPLTYPDGSRDALNPLRLLIGYGPESMYVAYNKFYPPELATLEARNASPDRSHNETFDALVITGLFGFLAWQVLYLSVFYYGLRWLGVVHSRAERNLLIGLWVGGALVVTLIITTGLGPAYLGVSIPLGNIVGLALYLVYYAVMGGSAETTTRADVFAWRRLVIIGLLAAVVAHFVEIHFGIAIAATRTHFFAFMATMVVVGTVLPHAQAEATVETVSAPAGRTARRRRTAPRRSSGGGWFGPAFGGGLLLALVLGILTYQYMTFTPRPGELESIQSIADLPTVDDILERAYLVNAKADFTRSPFIFGLVVVTWLFGLVLIFSELHQQGAFGPARSVTPLPAQRRLLVGGLTAVAGAAALVGGIYGIGARGDLVAVWGAFLALVWGVLALAAAGYWFLNEGALSRHLVGGVAALAFLFAVPVVFAGGGWQGLLLALVGGALLLLGWDSSWDTLYAPLVTMGVTALVLALLMALVQASLLRGLFIPPPTVSADTPLIQRRVLEGVRVTNFLTTYYVYAVAVLLAGATALGWRRIDAARSGPSAPGWLALAVLLPLSLVLVYFLNVRVIHADMIYKRGKPFDQQGTALAQAGQPDQSAVNWDIAIALYERAIDLVPREDFYYLWLGRALLEKTSVAADAERARLLADAERRLLDAQQINPLNTDHTANLARLNVRWAGSLPADRAEHVADAERHYRDALVLSPQNSIIRNELGSLYASLAQDCDRSLATFEESLAVDPYFVETYYALADTRVRCGLRLESEAEQIAAFDAALATVDEALNYLPRNPRRAQSIERRVAQVRFLIAESYAAAGALEKARDSAESALTLASPEFAAQIERFIAELDARSQG